MHENKKKIKKKDLLRRIEELAYDLSLLRDQMNAALPQISYPGFGTIVGPLTVAGTCGCSSCGVKSTEAGACMNTACPYAMKITC